MDILLIDPPYTSLKGIPSNRGYHVGLTSLAAYLRREGIEAAVLMGDLLSDLPSGELALQANLSRYAAGQRDYERILEDKNHPVWVKLADTVKQVAPPAVGIAYLTPLKYVVERIAALVKEIDKDIKVVVGSFHPTFCPEEVMRNPDIDFVIRGEGEIPLLHLVRELKKDSPQMETVPGLCYRDGDGQVKSNPAAGLIDNLDELPFPARDLVLNCDYDKYRAHSISTTRGCPYTCTFCSDRRFWGGRACRRSVANVLDEFRLLKDSYRRIDYVDIIDGTFTFDRKYLQTFCRGLMDRGLNIGWRCTARYDNLDEDILRLMKQSGCCGLYLGLESGSDRMLQAMDKKFTVEKIIKVSEMVHKSGIPVSTSILLGLPDEGPTEIEETLALMKKVKTGVFDVNTYIPLPGNRLYDAMSDEDKRNIDWHKVAYKSYSSHFTKRISPDDFHRYLGEAYKIANITRRKTIARFALRRIFGFLPRLFK